MTPQIRNGLAWYEERDYASILEIMDDAHVLPPTYTRWREKAEKVELELKKRGYTVVRAMISPDTFPAWCQAHGLKRVDAQARILFANYVAAGKA